MAKANSNNAFNKDKPLVKFFIFVGTIILLLLTILIMKYFFVTKSNILTNYSTDKQLIYITFSGKDELVTTQKYISDQGYGMRYDTENFKILKYKNQDIFRYVDNADILVLVEKSVMPSDCNTSVLENGYSNCYKYIDDSMDEYYVNINNRTYRLLVKKASGNVYDESIKTRINYMMGTFEIYE